MIYFIKSIITDKYLNKNRFIFLFKNKANKLNIKKEIEIRYNVSVKKIRTMILLLKSNRKYRKIKKVLIELKEGQSIAI